MPFATIYLDAWGIVLLMLSLREPDFLRMLLVLLRSGVFGLLEKAVLVIMRLLAPYSWPEVIFLLLLVFANELLGLTDFFNELYKVFELLLIVKLSNGLTASINSF